MNKQWLIFLLIWHYFRWNWTNLEVQNFGFFWFYMNFEFFCFILFYSFFFLQKFPEKFCSLKRIIQKRLKILNFRIFLKIRLKNLQLHKIILFYSFLFIFLSVYLWIFFLKTILFCDVEIYIFQKNKNSFSLLFVRKMKKKT